MQPLPSRVHGGGWALPESVSSSGFGLGRALHPGSHQATDVQIGPCPARDLPPGIADRVFTALLFEHRLARGLPGSQQPAVLDLPVELAIHLFLCIPEVAAAEEEAVFRVHRDL